MEILALQDIVKSGSIIPTDVTLSGELTPKQSRTFVKAIIAKDGFLKKVTSDVAGKLTKERSANDVAKGVLTRHVAGSEAPDANFKKLGKVGCTLDMTKGVELNAKITDDTLYDNADNPTFEQEQFDGFNTAFNNDLQLLGIIGKDDNAAVDAPFDELAVGWVYVAKNSAKTTKVVSSNTSQIERLKHVVSNMNEDVKGRATIVLSAVDYDEYQLEIAEKHQNTAVLLNADARRFMGYPIEVVNDMPTGTYLATIMKNFIFGIAARVKRQRWFNNEESALKYKFVVYPDYEFDIHKYVTLSEFLAMTLDGTTATMAVGATDTVTVTQAAGDGIEGVTAVTADEAIATTSYDSSTGVITITGVAEGVVDITVDDGTSTQTIAVTVTAV